MKRVPRVALAALLFTAACAASQLTGPSEDLPGSWEWVRSEGGIAGGTRTPASEGFTMRLEFDADGTVELFRDGQRVGATTWSVAIGDESSSHGAVPVVRYADALLGFPEQAVRFTTRDTLVLVDACCDGFAYTFVRIDP